MSKQWLNPRNPIMNDLQLPAFSGPLLITVLAILLGTAIYANWDRSPAKALTTKRDAALPPPTEVVSLRLYPIKSCRGIMVRRINLFTTGLDLDRNWMFVDAATKEFLTIRSDPTMTLIDTELNHDYSELTISVHGTSASVKIPTRPTKEWLESNTTLRKVEIWEQETDGYDYGPAINDVFSGHFSKPVMLIYKGPSPRPSGGNADPSLYGKEVPHHFADLMSVQIASEASLADLNKRLKDSEHAKDSDEELTIERFRPNIVVKGNEAWEEDRWKRVQIVTVMHDKQQLRRVDLDVVCRCARCQVPNVNPVTAEKHAKEPWNTLMKFRRVDQGGAAKYKPCFGMLCIPKGSSEIRVGESRLEALEMTDKHLYNTAKFSDL